jgi:hypothetical protein
MTFESIVTLEVVIVHEPVYADIEDSGALGPVLLGPGQQPPIPSGPSGTCSVLTAHPLPPPVVTVTVALALALPPVPVQAKL